MSDSPPPPGPAADTAPAASPWKGLHSYGEEDRGRFFGREREIAEVFRLIQRDTLTVVFARSGVGKTSLLRAGVVPLLREKDFLPIVSRFHPESASPIADMIQEIRAACGAAGVELVLPGDFDPGQTTMWEFFQAAEFWGPRNDVVAPVLVIDQFEEVFTLGRNAAATEPFLTQLADLAENRTPAETRQRVESGGAAISAKASGIPCRIVLLLREDYVSRLDRLRTRMPSILRNRFCLEPLTMENARAVILRAGSALVSPTVADQILKAVAGAEQGQAGGSSEIEPAYLSVMCDELFRRMKELGRDAITEDLVASEQGNILDGLYNRSFESLPPAVRIFVEERLLTDSGFRGTIPVAEAEAKGIPEEALRELVDRRLLRFEDRLGTTHVELSHDILTGLASASREKRRREETLTAEREKIARLEAQKLAEQRRLRFARAMIVLLVAALLGTVWTAYTCFVQEHSAYYRTFTKRWGFFEGADPISEEQARHMPISFKAYWTGIVWDGWKFKFKPPHRVVALDASLKPTAANNIGTYLWWGNESDTPSAGSGSAKGNALGLNKVCQWEYVPDANGNVAYERGMDRDGRMVWGFVYSPLATGTASLASGTMRLARFVGPDGYPLFQRASRAEFVHLTYDERGFEKEVTYSDAQKQPAPGPDGAFGAKFEHDDDGRQTAILSIDDHERTMIDNAGNCGMLSYYNTDGFEVKAVSVDTDRKPCLLKEGYCISRYEYDDAGNETRATYFDAGDKPCLRTEGYHGWESEYDTSGREIKNTWLDLNNKPMLVPDYGYATYQKEYDANGNVRRETYTDTAGAPCMNKEGEYGWEAEYDANGLETRRTLLGLDGRPMIVPSLDFASYREEYDERDNVRHVAYFDAADKPCLNKEGEYGWEAEYNDNGWETGKTLLGLDGKPMIAESLGFARDRKEYDDRGNLLLETYFDAADKPCMNKEGEYGWEASYDDRGREVTRRLLGPDGRPMMVTSLGYAIYRDEYDKAGNIWRAGYFDADDKPCVGVDGNHGWELEYDASGREIERTVLGVDDKPVLIPSLGFVSYWEQYDVRGNQVQVSYFDMDDNPCLNHEGEHGWESQYDDRGRETKRTLLGLDGKPMLVTSLGYAVYRQEYDKAGNLWRATYSNANDKPCLGADGSHGWESAYDDRGREIKRTLLDADDKPLLVPSQGFATYWAAYDDRGNARQLTYFDANGNACLGKDATHGWEAEYDDRGREIKRTVLGLDDKPLLVPPQGYTTYQVEYDDRGNVRRLTYFDATGKACVNADGVHGFDLEHDDNGNESRRTELGLDDKPALAPALGYATRVQTRDGAGNYVGSTFFDANGNSLPATAVATEIVPGGQAESLGIQVGDLIVGYGGNMISSTAQLIRLVQTNANSGAAVEIDVDRGGQKLKFTARAGRLGVALEDHVAPPTTSPPTPAQNPPNGKP